jgi:hypothetical protein
MLRERLGLLDREGPSNMQNKRFQTARKARFEHHVTWNTATEELNAAYSGIKEIMQTSGSGSK